ncbi:hypothetical protein MBUL_00732 [Methylobacterium bullatum]|uniref:Uncharacterized protein n=1 Tax=Methylobacterium bullatum TaxID=570505 RepID=A0A679IY57_9HYPH|nr:hypothetical protein MBUL_00732 [Methylobacterium bullatum]
MTPVNRMARLRFDEVPLEIGGPLPVAANADLMLHGGAVLETATPSSLAYNPDLNSTNRRP